MTTRAQNARLTHALAESERHYALKETELQLLQDGQDMLQQQLRVRAPARSQPGAWSLAPPARFESPGALMR